MNTAGEAIRGPFDYIVDLGTRVRSNEGHAVRRNGLIDIKGRRVVGVDGRTNARRDPIAAGGRAIHPSQDAAGR